MQLPFSKYRLLTFFGLYWVFLCLLSVALAVSGFFYKEIIISFSAAYGIFYLFLCIKSWSNISANLKFLPILIISVIFIYFLANGSTPTVFSGRDQGSLSEAAIRLSQNHNLYSQSPSIQEFYQIYGEGQALNYPGFNYTSNGSLVTHFPLGYISWLAVFYSFFGLVGFTIANSVTLLLFFVCFYLVARMYLSSAFSFWSWALAISSFLFSWFFKFTLSENLALFLFWFGLWEFLQFTRRRKRLYLLSSILSFFVLTFTRIEAIAIILMLFLVLAFKYRGKKLTERSIVRSWMMAPILISVLVYILSIDINLPFFKIFAKGFLDSFTNNGLPDGSYYSFPYPLFYLLKILGIYLLLHFVVLAVIGIIYLIRTKRYNILIPFWLSLPVWIYLANPSVSLDHPWMLRRYMFVIFPIAIIYSVIFLERIFAKRIFGHISVIILLAANIFLSAKYFGFWENRNLLAEIDEISANFSPNDLVLIDREATGDGFSMMTGPMNTIFGKQAAYFINPADLDKIGRSKFSNVFFIIPDKNQDFYSGISDRLELRREYRTEITKLDTETGSRNELMSHPVALPGQKTVVTYGKIYQLK